MCTAVARLWLCKDNIIYFIMSWYLDFYVCWHKLRARTHSRYNYVMTITCNRPPWRWPVFCASISYVTSQPKGQKLMEEEMACDFLPPTTVTMPQTHSIHMRTHTHAVLNLALIRAVWEPLPSLNKLLWCAHLSRKIWHCFLMLKLPHSHGERKKTHKCCQLFWLIIAPCWTMWVISF